MRTLLLLALVACNQAPEAAAPAASHEAGAHEQEGHGHEEKGHDEPAQSPEDAGTDAEGWRTYGEPYTLASAIPAEELFADPGSKAGSVVRVEGRVADVCQAQGCWMVLAHEDQLMRIRMKDHAFSVDRQGIGGTCDIEGELIEKTVDAEEAAHYASEASNKEALPEVGKDKVYELIAHSVRMKRSS